MDFLLDVRLTDGPLFWIAWAAGATGLVYLLWRRRAHWLWQALAAFLGAAAVVTVAHWLLLYVFSAFPDSLPLEVLAWAVPAVSALILWVMRLPGVAWRSRVTATISLLAVVLLSAIQINAYFGLSRTVGDLLGTAVARIPPLEAELMRQPGGKLPGSIHDWNPQRQISDGGVFRTAHIPGTRSGFSSRDAYVYLPPAYLAADRPALPVLVLFSGQPGSPADWLTGGALGGQMDRFAAQHGGLAPVVVVVDPNGSASGNSLCMDSQIAQADTFLSQDVPDWIGRTLDVENNHQQWAVGGFSFGATCALQMVTRHPEVYNSAIAFSSEREPALAKERQKTIEAAFGGNGPAFEAETPLSIMARERFEANAVYFGAGERDPEFVEYLGELSAAARRAGFAVQTKLTANTGHSWETPATGLPDALDFMAQRWGIQ